MNKELGHGLGWALIWFALLGGIALIVWASSQGPDLQGDCQDKKGEWVAQRNENGAIWYSCKFREDK